MKAGIVALVGRPNVGKSTLLNNLLRQKVSITSPKPQTTRFPIHAVYEDKRGQIIFVDTPGVIGKIKDTLSRSINQQTGEVLSNKIDLILYLIDTTRPRDFEENKVLGMVRKVDVPVILVINKADIPDHRFSSEYAFYEDEFPNFFHVSALKRINFDKLLEAIFAQLPVGKKLVDTKKLPHPGLNLDSKLYVSEIIREKVFLFMKEEVPYTVHTSVAQIEERANGNLYIKGKIITTADRYKSMLIGRGGRKIKEIGMAVRKELEVAAGKPVYVDLTVEVDPDWQDINHVDEDTRTYTNPAIHE